MPVSRPAAFQPSWESLKGYRVPDWYADAKFGIFIHWGPYCVPAFSNEWYPRSMYDRENREVFEHHRLIWGEHDPLFPLELGRRLHAHLGGRSRLHVIRGTAHSPNLERPRALNRRLLDFCCR